jgi:hypothetical protein
MSSGNRCLLVAVRSHFGLRLGGRNNPDRASNRILGRRITYHSSRRELSNDSNVLKCLFISSGIGGSGMSSLGRTSATFTLNREIFAYVAFAL